MPPTISPSTPATRPAIASPVPELDDSDAAVAATSALLTGVADAPVD